MKQENCCTPIGQIKRYVDCKGCDRKPKQETPEEAKQEQSAIEWYFKQMQSKEKFTQEEFDSIFEQAKEMEKQQIIDAYEIGNRYMFEKAGEQYYNETFNPTTPWYDEDQTTKRMNVVAQNGNDGEHYNK
jgi:hypothetical protein